MELIAVADEPRQFAEGRRKRMCYNLLRFGVNIAHLSATFRRSESTIKTYARGGRKQVQNRRMPWFFIPARVRTSLIKALVPFESHEDFKALLANLDNIEVYYFGPASVNAIRYAAGMPAQIEIELITDRQEADALLSGRKKLMEAVVPCVNCSVPTEARWEHSYIDQRGPFCDDCCRTAKGQAGAHMFAPVRI